MYGLCFGMKKKRNKGIKWHLEGILFICARAVIFKIINQTVQSSRLGGGERGRVGGGSFKSVLFMCSFRREKKNRRNVVAYNDWTDETMTIPVRSTWNPLPWLIGDVV